MKRILIGVAAALLAGVPVLAAADCGPDHATMASSSVSKKPALAQAEKAPATAPAKVATKHGRPASAKTTTVAASRQDAPTVVARTN
jgi:hypothetical protein